MKVTLTFEIETNDSDLYKLNSMIDSLESLLQGNIYVKEAKHVNATINLTKLSK